MPIFIYILYLAAAGIAILSSILKFRNVFHPQTLVVVIIFVLFMSDFIVTGYSERVLGDYTLNEILWPQIIILYVCCSIFVITYFLASHDRTAKTHKSIFTDFTWSTRGIIPWVAFLIVTSDVLKRLYFADWSPIEAVLLSIAPRGSAPWNIKGGDYGNLGDANFIFGLSTILMPFCSLTLYCRYLILTGLKKIVSLVFFVVSLVIMIFDGSRTPVVFVVAMTSIIYCYNSYSSKKKIVVMVVAVFLISALTSLMYLFRSEGYSDIVAQRDSIGLFYHQDDNHAQSIHSLITASDTAERWNALEFFTVIIVNPIPRYFWPGKPALLYDYWGNYKNEWTTITALGELTAMFGPIAGPLLTIPVTILLYLLLNYLFKRWNSLLSFLIYLIFSLYAYVVMRSLLNLSQFIYMPIFLLLLSRLNLGKHETSHR